MKLKIIFSLILFVCSHIGVSQVKFEAQVSKQKLGINERLRVDFEMNQDGDNFNPPSFQGFQIVGGPNQSISNTWINGRSTYSKTYSYYLQPNSKGKFTIGQAEITVEGEVYKTVPITVEVTSAVADPEAEQIKSVAADNIHLVAEISKTNPYLNEPVKVAYKLYVSPRTSVSNFREIDHPTYNGFWSQNISNQPSGVQTGEYKGEQYRYVVLKEVVLYPQKSGELTIEPLTLSVSVEVPTGERSFFGGMLYETVEQVISAGKKTLQVKPLPQENRPDNFSGAVGKNLDFKVNASKSNLKTSESLDLQVKVQGVGNLKLFDLPGPELPETLELYQPQHEENIRVTSNGMTGRISNTYTVVPTRAGTYQLDGLSFTYFDLDLNTYKTLTSEPITLEVEKGPAGYAAGPGKQKVEMTGEDFKFIKLETDLKPVGNEAFMNSVAFWSLYLAPFAAVPLLVLFGRKRRAKAADIHGIRIKKADKLAKKYLSEAKKNLGNQNSFYISLERALHNFLKAKLHIQTGEMSKENISVLLLQKGVNPEDITAFIALIKSCESARYAPSSQVEMEKDYEKAVQVISVVDKQL